MMCILHTFSKLIQFNKPVRFTSMKGDTANISEIIYKRLRYAEKAYWSSILGPVTGQWFGKFWIQ